jgi:hypothetical protein
MLAVRAVRRSNGPVRVPIGRSVDRLRRRLVGSPVRWGFPAFHVADAAEQVGAINVCRM